jgi:hypothetical protein
MPSRTSAAICAPSPAAGCIEPRTRAGGVAGGAAADGVDGVVGGGGAGLTTVCWR